MEVVDGAVFKLNPDNGSATELVIAQITVADGSHWRASVNVRGRSTGNRDVEGSLGHATGDWSGEDLHFDYRQTAGCVTDMAWVDINGNSCDAYLNLPAAEAIAQNAVPCSIAESTASGGKSATEACCACQGAGLCVRRQGQCLRSLRQHELLRDEPAGV